MSTSADQVYRESVRDVMHRPGEMRTVERELVAPEHFGEGIAQVPANSTLQLSLRLESVHEGILATASVRTAYVAECGRCLEEFRADLQVEFTELFAYTVTEADEYGVHGDHVNLEPPLRDAVVLALPFQPVCRPDCAGIDPSTGERRQAGDELVEDRGLDPRWAALQAFQAEQVRGEGEHHTPADK